MKEIILGKSAKEIHICVTFENELDATNKLREIANNLKAKNAELVTLEVFAPATFKDAIDSFMENRACPLNWIHPLDDSKTPLLAGTIITAVAGAQLKFAKTANGAKSVFYSVEDIEYCRAFGVLSPLSNDNAYEHTKGNLVELEASLANFGFKYTDIARTWFYNDDILAWYADFNKARTEFYRERGIFEKLLPASTGIGTPNVSGKKITSGAIAIKGDGKWSAIEVESPLQCGAPDYGSSFSRAVEIETPFSRRLMISGTASLEFGGKTAHIGNIQKQVEATLEAIGAILKSRDMTFADTTRAVVYCLRPEYYEVFKKWTLTNGNFAHVPSFSVVCRDDFLFEIELEAVVNK